MKTIKVGCHGCANASHIPPVHDAYITSKKIDLRFFILVIVVLRLRNNMIISPDLNFIGTKKIQDNAHIIPEPHEKWA